MKEEYINNIKAHKEVLQTLPKNNQRNINEYNKTVEGMIQTYRKNLQEIKEEIIKRNKNFTNNMPVKRDRR